MEACRSSVLDQMSKLHNFISDMFMMPFYILGFASSRKVSSRKIFYIRFAMNHQSKIHQTNHDWCKRLHGEYPWSSQDDLTGVEDVSHWSLPSQVVDDGRAEWTEPGAGQFPLDQSYLWCHLHNLCHHLCLHNTKDKVVIQSNTQLGKLSSTGFQCKD